MCELNLEHKICYEYFGLQYFLPLQAAELELAAEQPSNTNALAIRRPFDPKAHDLDAHFRLTSFVDLKGRGCKVPQEVLLKLLEGLQDDANSQEEHHFMHMAIPKIGELIVFNTPQPVVLCSYNPLSLLCCVLIIQLSSLMR